MIKTTYGRYPLVTPRGTCVFTGSSVINVSLKRRSKAALG